MYIKNKDIEEIMTKRLNCVEGKGKRGVIHSPLDLMQGALIKLPEYVKLKANSYRIFHAEEQQQFVLIKGDDFAIGSEYECMGHTSGAYIYSIPIGALLTIYAHKYDIDVIALNFHPTFNLCLGACPSKTGCLTKEAEREILGQSNRHVLFRSLPFSEGLEKWFASVKDYLSYSYTDFFLYELKLQELFRLLNLEYTRATLNDFICQFHCKESGFRKRVYALKGRPITLEELAEYLEMSESILKRRFLTEFGMPPQKWLALQRSRYIFRDIIQSKAQIKDIAQRYEFSTTSYLSLFCKKYLGDTPQNIRKRFSECQDNVE